MSGARHHAKEASDARGKKKLWMEQRKNNSPRANVAYISKSAKDANPLWVTGRAFRGAKIKKKVVLNINHPIHQDPIIFLIV